MGEMARSDSGAAFCSNTPRALLLQSRMRPAFLASSPLIEA